LRNDRDRICQKFPKLKREENLIQDQAISLEKLSHEAITNFRFIKILIMNAHVLNDLTQLDPKDVVSVGGKLIIGSPYNN
jgi:hypothetical protein